MSTNADRVEFHRLFLRLAGPLKRGVFVEQCDCVFDFNFLTIFCSMYAICVDLFFQCTALVGFKGAFRSM